MKDKNKKLIGLAIISWYLRLVGIIIFFFGLIVLFLDKKILNTIILEAMPYLSFLGDNVITIVGIFSISLGVIYFLISSSLERLKNWARISLIILTILQMIVSLISTFTGDIFSSLFSLVIPFFILYYLFKKDVRESFKN